MHNFNIKWFYTYNKFRSLACLRSCFFENLFIELRDICHSLFFLFFKEFNRNETGKWIMMQKYVAQKYNKYLD